MIRARLTPSTNGNGAAPPAFKHIPPDLRKEISEILEMEGMMETSAENRILTRMDGHHKETLSEIGELKEKIHGHDKRLTLVEASVGKLEDAEKTAGEERRSNGRMVKGALVASIMGIIVSALMSVYGPGSRAVPEVKQDAAAISTQLKELIDVIKQDREDRKTTETQPANTLSPKPRHSRVQRPEPVPGPGARLREGETIAPDPFALPYATLRSLSRQGDL